MRRFVLIEVDGEDMVGHFLEEVSCLGRRGIGVRAEALELADGDRLVRRSDVTSAIRVALGFPQEPAVEVPLADIEEPVEHIVEIPEQPSPEELARRAAAAAERRRSESLEAQRQLAQQRLDEDRRAEEERERRREMSREFGGITNPIAGRVSSYCRGGCSRGGEGPMCNLLGCQG